MVQIVWLTNKAGNTGEDGGLAQVLHQALEDPSRSSIVEKPATMTSLEEWCTTNGYIEYPTKLCAAFGQYLKLYGAPYKFSKEHCGRNNIIATFLACDDVTGLAPTTVIGKAVLVRLDGPNGKPVDLTREEVIRTGFFLDDLMDSYGDDWTHREWLKIFQGWKRCFLYYDAVTSGDSMGSFDMNGHDGRWMSGTTGQQKDENSDACTFDIVRSFRIA